MFRLSNVVSRLRLPNYRNQLISSFRVNPLVTNIYSPINRTEGNVRFLAARTHRQNKHIAPKADPKNTNSKKLIEKPKNKDCGCNIFWACFLVLILGPVGIIIVAIFC